MSTSTAPKLGRRARQNPPVASPSASGGHAAGLVPEPPRVRRRPLIVVLAVIAVCLGALLGVWAWTTNTTQTEVVGLRRDVPRGALIQSADLMQVRVGLDPALRTVPASGLAALVGKRAGQDMAAGSLLNPTQVTDGVVPPAGMSLVGLPLSTAQMPAVTLRNGDQVRVVSTPPKGTAVTAAPVVVPATVQDLVSVGDPKSGTQQTVVNVLVPSADAADLASRAAGGTIALVLDSRER